MGIAQLHPYYHPRDESPRPYDDDEIMPHPHSSHTHDYRPGRSRALAILEPDERRSRSAIPRGQQHSGVHTPTRAPHHHHTESPHGQHGERRPHSEGPKKNKRRDHAMEKAIGAGSAAAFHLRDSQGSWVGGKGLKVAGAASVAALIDYTLDKDAKSHRIRHIALSMITGGITEAIVRAGEDDGHDHDHDHDSAGSHGPHGGHDSHGSHGPHGSHDSHSSHGSHHRHRHYDED